jgi:hypothetical protein
MWLTRRGFGVSQVRHVARLLAWLSALRARVLTFTPRLVLLVGPLVVFFLPFFV